MAEDHASRPNPKQPELPNQTSKAGEPPHRRLVRHTNAGQNRHPDIAPPVPADAWRYHKRREGLFRQDSRNGFGNRPIMIGWILLSREAVARAEEALASTEKGVRDEVGFLALHQGFADRFFPGTSVLHTRLRYVLFVPWLMNEVASNGGTDIARRFSAAETALAGQLKDGPDSDGIIGGRVWPRPTAQPPSMTYWSALGSWGILRQRDDRSLPTRTQTLRRLSRPRGRVNMRLNDDDGGALDGDTTSPFVSLPRAPKAIRLRGEPLDFRLSPVERSFLRRHLFGVRRPTTATPCLLAGLTEAEVGPETADLWVTAVEDVADAEDRAALVTARHAAGLAGIGRAVYAALVEITQAQDGLHESTIHRNHLHEMLELHGHNARDWERLFSPERSAISPE